MQKRVRVLVTVSVEDSINIRIKVVWSFNLRHDQTQTSINVGRQQTYGSGKLQYGLAGNMSFFGVIFDLNVDDVDRAVILSTSCQKI